MDTILASQRNLCGYNNVSMERKKQRKDAQVIDTKYERERLLLMKICSILKLERLCGHSLQDCNKINSLKKFAGLVLKDEFMEVTDLDEEKFHSRDWEEREIIILD